MLYINVSKTVIFHVHCGPSPCVSFCHVLVLWHETFSLLHVRTIAFHCGSVKRLARLPFSCLHTVHSIGHLRGFEGATVLYDSALGIWLLPINAFRLQCCTVLLKAWLWRISNPVCCGWRGGLGIFRKRALLLIVVV